MSTTDTVADAATAKPIGRVLAVLLVIVALWLPCAGFELLDPAAFQPPPAPDRAYTEWVLAAISGTDQALLVVGLGRLALAVWLLGSAIAAASGRFLPAVATLPLAVTLGLIASRLQYGVFHRANTTSLELDPIHAERIDAVFEALGRSAGHVAYQQTLIGIWCTAFSVLALVAWWRSRP